MAFSIRGPLAENRRRLFDVCLAFFAKQSREFRFASILWLPFDRAPWILPILLYELEDSFRRVDDVVTTPIPYDLIQYVVVYVM